MSGSLWIWVALVSAIGALRWTLADLLLDRFGWLTDWMRRGERREGPAGGQA